MSVRDLYGTDSGPACKCGGTVYEYRVASELLGVVVTRCVSCGRVRLLYLDNATDRDTPLDSATIRAQHVKQFKREV